MKLIITTLLTVFGAYVAVAQCGTSTPSSVSSVSGATTFSSFNGTSLSNIFSNSSTSNVYQSSLASYQQVQGSAFLNEEPVKGTVVLNDDSSIEDVPLMVDLYANHVITKKDNGDMMILDGRFYKEIRLTHEGEEIVLKKSDKNNSDKFYQVLYDDGDMVFLKDNYVTMREASNNGYSRSSAKFTKRTNYFIQYGDNQMAKVKLKKKDIFPLIPDSELYAMQEFARKKGLKLNSELNFIAFFEGGKQ